MPSQYETARVQKKLANERFRKRKETCFKKCHYLSEECQADVFFALRYRGKLYYYTSTESQSWPPSLEDIVSFLLSTKLKIILLLIQSKYYPLPIQKLPVSSDNGRCVQEGLMC